MADDLQNRLTTLEMNFDAYMAMFYKWLDELRTDMRDMKDLQRKLVENDTKIVETQGMLVRLIDALDDKLDKHEGRLAAGGL